MNFNLVAFLSFYLEGLTINYPLKVQLDYIRDFNSLHETPFPAVIFHPIGMKFWIQLTKTYLSWTMKPDFLLSIRVEWYLGKSLRKLAKIMPKVHDFGLYHEICSKETNYFRDIERYIIHLKNFFCFIKKYLKLCLQ